MGGTPVVNRPEKGGFFCVLTLKNIDFICLKGGKGRHIIVCRVSGRLKDLVFVLPKSFQEQYIL